MRRSLLLFICSVLGMANLWAQAIPANYDTLLQLPNGLPIYFKYIPAGQFSMGSSPGSPMHERDEAPVRTVTLTAGFYLGIYEVTQAQWEAVMGENPAIFRVFDASPEHPVEYVTWNQTQDFIGRLNAMDMGTFRLPTEAEWEYACRAGTQSAYFWGDKMSKNGSSEYTWANSRSHSSTNPVGSKKPNPWGLYDMSGNVWEWCQDWYAPYPEGEQTDPKGPETGKMKVFRGGSWFDFYEAHRSANRHKHAPDEPYTAIGLRLAWQPE